MRHGDVVRCARTAVVIVALVILPVLVALVGGLGSRASVSANASIGAVAEDGHGSLGFVTPDATAAHDTVASGRAQPRLAATRSGLAAVLPLVVLSCALARCAASGRPSPRWAATQARAIAAWSPGVVQRRGPPAVHLA